MNFFEAMTALQSGKKVRVKTWPANQWVGLKEFPFKFCGFPKTKLSVLNEAGEEPIAKYSGGGAVYEQTQGAMLNILVTVEWEEFKEGK